jgi:hypothetical protein
MPASHLGQAPEQLALRVDPEANSIAWLVWHLTGLEATWPSLNSSRFK